MKPYEIIALCVLCSTAGLELGAWSIVWIGRWADGRVRERHIAELAEAREESGRKNFDRGYAAALGIRAEIDAPRRQRKER